MTGQQPAVDERRASDASKHACQEVGGVGCDANAVVAAGKRCPE
jgi:hypothetical protein